MADISKPLTTAKQTETKMVQEIERARRSVFHRFPLLFTLLGTFGLVATFYGLEHIIDNISFLAENPALLLAVGIGTLVFTGQLYKKLG